MERGRERRASEKREMGRDVGGKRGRKMRGERERERMRRDVKGAHG